MTQIGHLRAHALRDTLTSDTCDVAWPRARTSSSRCWQTCIQIADPHQTCLPARPIWSHSQLFRSACFSPHTHTTHTRDTLHTRVTTGPGQWQRDRQQGALHPETRVSAACALTAKRKPTSWGIMSARARRLIPLHQRLHKLLLPRVQPKAAEGFTRAFIAARVKIELTCKGMLRLQPTPLIGGAVCGGFPSSKAPETDLVLLLLLLCQVRRPCWMLRRKRDNNSGV